MYQNLKYPRLLFRFFLYGLLAYLVIREMQRYCRAPNEFLASHADMLFEYMFC